MRRDFKVLTKKKGMTLTFIGLGLYDHKDVTLRGKEAIQKADLLFLEQYTSLLAESRQQLEKVFRKKIMPADRELVEQRAEEILTPALTKEVAFLVVGDPMAATTHADLYLRARQKGIEVKIIHNASIMNAIGAVGLELYKYGKTTSIVFPELDWTVETHYNTIKQNQEHGLHTLCLLDIKVKEARKDDLRTNSAKGKARTEPRFMTVNDALRNLLTLEKERKENVITDNHLVVGVARLGHPDQIIKSGTIKELLSFDFGKPLHTLIIPGTLHFIEEEMLKLWK